MYKGLADGHATKFIQDRHELAQLLEWRASKRRKAAVAAFLASVGSKKPGRVLERLIPYIRPPFGNLQVAQWDKELKAVFSVRVAAAVDADIFYMEPSEKTAFSERSAFLVDLLMLDRRGHHEATLSIAAGICHHAISRLLEREASTPETLRSDVLEILQQVRALRHFLSMGLEHGLTKLRDGMTYDLIVPFRSGGVVIRTLRVNAASKELLSEPLPVFSIRTFLDESMLTIRQKERMAGFRLSRDALVSAEDSSHSLRWIQGNAEETDPRRRLEVP